MTQIERIGISQHTALPDGKHILAGYQHPVIPINEANYQEISHTLVSLPFGKKIGTGGQLTVQELATEPGLVTKRLQVRNGGLYRQGTLSRAEYFHRMQEEHELLLEYFGYEFVPYTLFVKSDLPEGQEGDYIMFQEKIYGEYDIKYGSGLPTEPISNLVKNNFLEFRERYRVIMRERGIIPEDQIMIDFATGDIKIYDTNFLKTFRERLDNNALLRIHGIDPQIVQTTTDVRRVLNQLYPQVLAANNVNQMTDVEFGEFFCDVYGYTDNIHLFGTSGMSFEELAGIQGLLSAVGDFPSEGDNTFIRAASRQLGIDS